MYKFNEQNQIGKEGEKLLDSWLKSTYTIDNVSNLKKYQKSGIDRLLTNKKGEIISVEYKFDKTAQRTGNLFFETVSIDKNNNPGWGFSSQADYWIFLIPTNQIFIFKPSKLRLFAWQNYNDLQEKKIKNRGYFTLGYPLKINLIKHEAHCITNLQSLPPLL